MQFSDYIIYVDESGDHSLQSIDPEYPIFALSFCIFRKVDYFQIVVPRVQEFKFKWFGHDHIILHENEIAKSKGHFGFLQYDRLRERFMSELSDVVKISPMIIISAVINKERLRRQYVKPTNPYELALLFCLERSFEFLESQENASLTTHIVCEARSERKKDGKTGREDAELELEFRRIIAGQHELQARKTRKEMPNFQILFASKLTNSTGLQLADLTARPIGIKAIRPQQDNRAFQIISEKLWKGHDGRSPDLGLKIFP